MSASFLSSPKIPHSVSTSVPWDQWWGCHWGSSAFREVAPQWVLEVVLYRPISPGAPEQERNKAQLHRMVAAHKKHIWMIEKKKIKIKSKNTYGIKCCCFSAQGILLSWFFAHVVLFAWTVLFPSLFLSNSCLSFKTWSGSSYRNHYSTLGHYPCMSVITWLVWELSANGSAWDHELFLLRDSFDQFCSSYVWLLINTLRKYRISSGCSELH